MILIRFLFLVYLFGFSKFWSNMLVDFVAFDQHWFWGFQFLSWTILVRLGQIRSLLILNVVLFRCFSRIYSGDIPRSRWNCSKIFVDLFRGYPKTTFGNLWKFIPKIWKENLWRTAEIYSEDTWKKHHWKFSEIYPENRRRNSSEIPGDLSWRSRKRFLEIFGNCFPSYPKKFFENLFRIYEKKTLRKSSEISEN